MSIPPRTLPVEISPGGTLSSMVDLHHHILPGLDDGSPDLATSVSMARAAAADGITHVVATPHANSRYPFNPSIIAERLSALQQALATESIPLTLAPGCDFHLSYDNIQDALAHPAKYTINAKNYLLVELPDFGIAPNLAEAFYDFQLAGITPILTHPERNRTLQRDPARLAEWMRSGMLTQITTSSILGKMGKEAERMAHKLLADRWVHFLATDAHNLTSRPPLMRQACEQIAAKYGVEYATRLCQTNPLAVFNGQPLSPQEEPRSLYEESDASTNTPWYKSLFK